MAALSPTFTRAEAIAYTKLNRRSDQIYLKRFDVDVVFRKGKKIDAQLTNVRHKEDNREEMIYNKRTQSKQPKKNDIVTYKLAGKKIYSSLQNLAGYLCSME